MDHSTTSTSRRAFLRTTGAAGATLAAGASLAGGVVPGIAAAADNPTKQQGNFFFPDLPKQPTPEDILLLSFANSLARAAVEIYDKVLAAKSAESFADVLDAFRNNHRAHAGSFSALVGSAGASVANRTLLLDYSGSTLGSPLPALSNLEASLLATHQDLLGKLVGIDGATAVGATTPILARHLVVLGEAQRASNLSYLPSFDEPTSALTPDLYPVERV